MTIEEPRFLVDASLQRLGRWLRAAGYDSDFASESDSEYYLLREALNRGRLLLTQNPALAELRRAPGIVILLEGESLDECAEELSAHVTIDWEHNPFTRCTVCNTEFTSSDEETPFCASCKQIIWDGSYLNDMRQHLGKWHRKFTR
ncbi:MAG: Mut7-C RNAse domain-containing protein [Thioalkalispiraceae bacterium]|jgi:uncharacterized protein with PIN domain